MSRADEDLKVTLSVGAEATNAIIITGAVTNSDGDAVAAVVDCYFADDAAGDELIDTAHSGTTEVSTGENVGSHTAKKDFKVLTTSAGAFAITATEVGAKSAYLVAVVNGKRTVSDVITHAA